MSEQPVLQVEGLRKTYGRTVALAGVDLAVRSGQVVCLLGPNGAGKTTLVSIIAGLRRADAGSVVVGGIDAVVFPQRARRLIGLAPQDLGIYPIVTVRQNLALFGELTGRRGSRLDEAVEGVAAAVHIDDLLDRKAGELSGGQKRRLHTAISLIGDPPLVMLDEATTGADVATRAALLDVVTDLAARGSAVLYSTHYLQEVETLEADVVLLEEGSVIASGHVGALISGHGRPVIELVFDGEIPTEGLPATAEREGSLVRIPTVDPTATLAEVLARLDGTRSTVRSIEVIEPSLEAVYLALTGTRYRAETDAEEAADVLAT